MKKNDFVFLITIANSSMKQILIDEIASGGGLFIDIIKGHGSFLKVNQEDDLIDRNKTIITTVMKKEKSVKMINILITKYLFNEPNTGIAFTIPIEGANFNGKQE